MIVLGIILCALPVFATIYIIVTGNLRITRFSVFTVIPGFIGLMLIYGGQDTLVYVAVVVGSLVLCIGMEGIYENLNDVAIDRTTTKLKRLGVPLLFIAMYGLLRYVLYPVMSSFLEHLQKLVSIPRFISVVTTFIVTYCITILIFGIIYAALHVMFEGKGFRSESPLQLRDFFLYSAFNIATQGYKDMVPEHWILSSLSILQIFIGIVLLGIYLAGAFTFIVQSPPTK